MYFFHSRIRYSEIGSDGLLTTGALINYFQDCSTFQSEDLGVGIGYLTSQNRCWIINSWQMNIVSMPKLGQEVTVYTWPNTLNGVFGTRNFKMTDKEGNLLAVATSLWTFFDTQNLRPTKITQDIIGKYELEPAFEADWEGRKIALPKQMDKQETFFVQRGHLDTNLHVNNGQYVQMAMAYLPKDFCVKSFRAEYKKAAVYGDAIISYIYIEETRVVVSLAGTDETPYAIIEFKSS